MTSTPSETFHRFKYHPPTSDDIRRRHEEIRDVMSSAASWFESLCPESRERALALTKLEEAMFWANAAVARNQ